MEISFVKKIIRARQAQHSILVEHARIADRYYRNKPDILFEQKKKEDEKPLRNADNKIPFNFHGLLVNQKASYLFTAPPLFDLGSDNANKKLSAFLGDKFAKVCKDLCINASNATVAWLQLWQDEAGNLKYGVVPSSQILPIWSDDLERELTGVLKIRQQTDENGEITRIYEYWDKDICAVYEQQAGDTLDGLSEHKIFTFTDFDGAKESNIYEHRLGDVPFVPFFNNNTETDDLLNIKDLIDCYCKVFSGFVNDLEDIQEVIFVLTNYGGEDLGEFLRNLKNYKAIQIENEGGESSGVSTLTIELPVEARKELLATTRKCIFEQGQGIDPDPQNFGNSSGVALDFLYSLLELKSGLMETEFKLGFGKLIRFVCRILNIPIRDNSITQTWTRTKVRNDLEIADICSKSKGVISDETIVSRHPYVENTERELEKLKEQEENGRASMADLFDVNKKQEQEGEPDEE